MKKTNAEQISIWEYFRSEEDNNNKNNLKFIDLFCGLGGFRIAFENQKCKCVFSSDIDLNVQKTYFNNFDEKPYGDITKIDEKDIPNHNILCAGFPCQSFSIAGKRLGFDDVRGTMFFEVARIIKAKKPEALFLENVKGLTNHDGGKTLQTILSIITDLGYDYTYKVLNAKDYNVPQNRERWYCICFRKDLNININEFKFPDKQPLNIKIKHLIIDTNDTKYNISENCKNNIEKYLKLKAITPSDDTLAYEVRASRCQFKNDGVSPCLTAKMGTGGNNVPIIVNKKRRLTEQECLRIMGYPDWYIIGKGSHAYKQIGNSVVVPIINQIAAEIVRLLKKEDI